MEGPLQRELNPRLILVDEEDVPRGHADRDRCHEGAGLLHRAFSVYLFDGEGRLLLQRRAPEKPLWPGYWSNSCCSHPREEDLEDTAGAARRRLGEELGVEADFEFAFKYVYRAEFGERGTEHELCWVFVGRFDGEPRPDPREVDGWRWSAPDELEEELREAPDTFTPWFRLAWPRVRPTGSR